MHASRNPSHPFWIARDKLILASGSATRRALLESAAIPVESVSPDIDERAIERNADPAHVAMHLAEAKARAVSSLHPGRLVLGADQTLTCGEASFHKPDNAEAAARQIAALAGRTHDLTSAAALVIDGERVGQAQSVAAMTMRPLSDDFIASYVAALGPRATASVGAYQWEGLGVHLFERVEGDHFTILGLPLLPLLGELRHLGYLAS